MVTSDEYIDNGVYKGAVVLFGLSTDDKPINVGNGSVYVAIDLVGATDEDGNSVNFVYCFDAENNEWYPQESDDSDADDTEPSDADDTDENEGD